MFRRIKKLWRRKPLMIIMPLAILARLLFAFASWSAGTLAPDDFNRFYGPGKISMENFFSFYSSLNYIYSLFFDYAGITDIGIRVFIDRLIHGAWSLLTVYFGYKITERLASRRSARLTGILLALTWYLPAFFTRLIPEPVAITFAVLAIWFIISREDNPALQAIYFISGLFLGFAFIIYPGIIFFILGLFLAILIQKRWGASLGLIFGISIPVVLIQGSMNYFFLDRSFFEQVSRIGELFAFPGFSITSDLIRVTFAVILPPVSLFLFIGFFRICKKHLVVFLPVMIYYLCLFFIYPYSQIVTYVLPLPFLIIGGVAGWNDYLDRSPFWQERMKWLRYCWIFFWIINIIVLFASITLEWMSELTKFD